MQENKTTQTKNTISTYFLGSGRLAIPVLARLAESSKIKLLGAGTQPDRPGGRRRRPRPTPVGEYAEQAKIPLDKPESVNSPDFLVRINFLQPEIIIVAAFGQILKRELLNTPPFGCLNVHASLLPAHRGAAPVAAAILAGDQETGISFMRMEEGLDTGPVYTIRRLVIDPEETAEELEERLSRLAGDDIVQVLRQICRDQLRPREQNQQMAGYAGKIKKKDAQTDWSQPAEKIARKIRAYQPWPRVAFQIETNKKEKRQIQIVKARPVELPEPAEPGEIRQVSKNNFTIACGRGGIQIEHLIPEGSRPMSAAEFLRGTPLREGQKINYQYKTDK